MEQKSAEKKMVGPSDFGWLGPPSLSAKRSEQNENERNKNWVAPSRTIIIQKSGTKIIGMKIGYWPPNV